MTSIFKEEYLEPSAGNGSFLNNLPDNVLSYDLYPEDERIIKQDYLTLDLQYKKGRLVIGNPPFGNRNTLLVKFYKKSIELCDYISFILPISQYKNTQKMYEFDLIHSEDLGLHKYSGEDVHCCLNIYRRNFDGNNKSPKKHSFKDLSVVEFRRGSKDIAPKQYDFGMCTWGDGSCGKEIVKQGQYAQEHYIIIHNDDIREEIMRVCKTTDWRNLYPSVSSAKLQTWKIYKYIKEQIPEIN